MFITSFWNRTPRWLLEIYRHSCKKCCLHHLLSQPFLLMVMLDRRFVPVRNSKHKCDSLGSATDDKLYILVLSPRLYFSSEHERFQWRLVGLSYCGVWTSIIIRIIIRPNGEIVLAQPLSTLWLVYISGLHFIT
jgi:hypothetical protein